MTLRCLLFGHHWSLGDVVEAEESAVMERTCKRCRLRWPLILEPGGESIR